MADEIKEALKQKDLTFGANSVMRKLKKGQIKKVIISSNCKKEILEDIEHFSKLNKAEVVKLGLDNERLALACKKPFNVSVLGY